MNSVPSSARGLRRRAFLGSVLAAAAAPALPPLSLRASSVRAPVKFLFMSDTHIESDFWERDHPVYTCWQPGNHAALLKTYAFINSDPFCRDVDFAFFCGDQMNTGYTWAEGKELDAELAIWKSTLATLDVHRKTLGSDLSSFRFVAAPWTCTQNLGRERQPFDVLPPPLASRAIVLQGNHDTGVRDFYRDCAFSCGGTRFICFFASYVGLPPPPGRKYHSTGAISDETLAFIAREMELAAADPSTRHIVLFCHWALAPAGRDFIHPIVDACPSNHMNDNRRKLLALCEKHGCDLYVNGHEHNCGWPMAKVGPVTDVNCGTVAGDRGSFAVVELFDDRAVFNVYARAVAQEKDGSVVFSQLPYRQFARTVPLRPRGR